MNQKPASNRIFIFTNLTRLGMVALILTLTFFSALGVTPAHAANTWTVQSSADGVATPANCPGPNCRLRDAIAAAAAGDTIDFASGLSGTTITLTSGTLTLSRNVTIDGGTNGVTVSGNNAVRVFSVNAGVTFTLQNITVANGRCNSCNGGGINNAGTLNATNVTFKDNQAAEGGGIYNNNSVTLLNVTFYNNIATSAGGGLRTVAGNVGIRHATFNKNSTSGYGGAISIYGGILGLHSSIAYGNTAPNHTDTAQIDIYWLAMQYSYVNYSVVQGGCPTSGWLDCDPATTTAADPKLGTLGNYGGATETVPILAGSSAIDYASDYDRIVHSDQRGLYRPQGAHDDAGAFEYNPGSPGSVYHVKPSASGNGTCITWTNACTLQNALLLAMNNQEIWVAQGVYTPTTTADRAATFQLKSGVTVYGGFPNTGDPVLADRDPLTHVAILSGDIDTNDINTDGNNIDETHTDIAGNNSYHVVTGASGATLDGFTVTGGNANGSNPNDSGGGGMYNDYGSSSTVTNVTFSGNSATTGGGMFNYSSSPTVTNVTFSGNSATTGGGMYNAIANPTLTNVTFSGNSATQYGGGMYNSSSSPTVANVTFSDNSATTGGGMYNSSSSPTVTNVTFSGNSATQYGGGMYSNSSSPTLKNVIIANSTSGGDCNSSSTLNAASANNLIESTGANACGLSNGDGKGSIVGFDPLLGELGSYGGSTSTFPLLPGSPAIDAGNDTVSICDSNPADNFDQRGITRPQGAHCDIGAFESRGFTLGSQTGTPQSAFINTAFATPLGLTVTSSHNEPVDGGQVKLSAPVSGASLVTIQYTLPIPANGMVSQSVTANGTPDSYAVTASAAGATSVDFALTNTNTLTSLASSANPSLVNQSVTFTATVSPSAATGTVTFKDGGANVPGCVGVSLSAGQATCAISTLTIGAHSITAEYSGNATYIGSMGTLSPNQQVNCINAITVTNNADSGQGSLRQAMADVCSGGTIDFDNNYTITLGSQLPAVSKTMTITGKGAANTIIQASTCNPVTGKDDGGNTCTPATYRVFEVGNAGNLTIDGLTVRNGVSSVAGGGVINSGTLTVKNSAISDNSGSGIFSYGIVTMTNSTLSGNSTTMDGGGIYNGGALTITDSAVSGNYVTNGDGGGIYDYGGSLTVTSSTFSGNYAATSDGGGIFSYGIVTVKNSVFSGNSAHGLGGGIYSNHIVTVTDSSAFLDNSAASGGGVYNYHGSVTVTDSTFSDNKATTASGGGVYNDYGSVTVTDSTFSDNKATAASGGGVYSSYGNMTVTDSTFSGNSATTNGGGVYNNGHLTLRNSTFSGNSATTTNGGGVYNNGYLTLRNDTFSGNSATSGGGIRNDNWLLLSSTVIANSTTGGDCVNTSVVSSAVYNLIEDSGNACGMVNGDGNNNIVGFDPLLGTLGNYGGNTNTFPLLPGSSAIDTSTSCILTTDQRGKSRVGTCDIGAFESQGFTLGSQTGTPQSTVINTAFGTALGLTVTANNVGEPVDGGQVTFTPNGTTANASITTSPATIGAATSGKAKVTATANGTVGAYTVTASAKGATPNLDFSLTNTTDPADFVITVKTDQVTLGSTTFTIPTDGVSTYNFNVDCNDDGTNEATAQTGNYTCNYGSAGTYTLRIKDNTGAGTGFPAIYFLSAPDAVKLKTIQQWGTGKWTSMLYAFADCTNMDITATDVPDLSGVSDMTGMFSNDVSLTAPDLSSWDTSRITKMDRTFNGASAFNGNIRTWNTSSVGSMNYMFQGATVFNQNISGWNTSGVGNMAWMFQNASAFNQNLGSWDVSALGMANGMFRGATLSTANYDALLQGWDAQALRTGVTFSGGNSKYCAGAVAHAHISSADHWTITDGGGCPSATTSAATSITSSGAVLNGTVNASGFSTTVTFEYGLDTSYGSTDTATQSPVTGTTDTAVSKAITGLTANTLYHYRVVAVNGQGTTDGGDQTFTTTNPLNDFVITVNTSWVDTGTSPNTQFIIPTDTSGWMTYNYNVDCNSDGINEVTGVTGDYICEYGVTGLNTGPGEYTVRIEDNIGAGTGFPAIYFLSAPDAVKLKTIQQWGTGKWTSMLYAFADCTNMDITATDVPDLSGVSDMTGMFSNDVSLTAPDLSSWDTSRITKMDRTFNGASAFNGNIRTWNTSSVGSMNYMFQGATVFNQNISGWNTSGVGNMAWMFQNASAFNQNLGSWDVSALGMANGMFRGATLSTANYDALLQGWDAQALRTGVTFSGGNSQYCLGEATRTHMMSTYGWAITDGGRNCPNQTVTFNANGGSGSMANQVANVPTALTSNTFSRTGYTFSGWNTVDVGGGTSYANGATYDFLSDLTLFAQWTPIHTVTYALDGGVLVPLPTQADVATGGTFTVYSGTEPTKSGYTFGGWNDGTNTYAANATYTMGASNVTLTAVWSATSQTVTYNLDGGILVPLPTQADVVTGGTFTIYSGTAPTKAGYNFGGWNDGNNTYLAGATYTMGANNVTLTAVWNATSQTVTYNLDGGILVPLPIQADVATGGTFTIYSGTAPTKAGYNFGGWNDGNNTYLAGATYTMGASNVTLTAVWNATSQTVTYNLDGGILVPLPTQADVATGGTFTIYSGTAPTKAGYIFGGWNDGTNTYLAGATYTMGANNVTLTAQWAVGLSINNITLNEGNSGTTTFSFTVSLSAPASIGGVTFDIATADNTATTANNDYTAKAVTGATIPAGQSAYTFDVLVNGDTSIEADETFDVNITNITNAILTGGSGQGAITNDDSLSVEMTSLSANTTSVSPIPVTVTFSDAATGFIAADITVANGAVSNFSGSGALYTFDLIPASQGLVTADIAAGAALDSQNNGNTAAPQFRRIYDTTSPTVGATSLLLTYTSGGLSSFTVTFSEDVNNPVGDTDTDDVTNPANYFIVNKGANGIVDTISCRLGLAGDDTQAAVSSVIYIPNTAVVTLAAPLPIGSYRLFVCGTTSIVDLGLNPLNNGADSTFEFTITATPETGGEDGDNDKTNARSMPRTGFAPNVTTILPPQPAELAYTQLSDLWIEIPSQNVKSNIVGVPQSDDVWDVKWLGKDTGWLNGTAFPSWEGNSVLTAHLTDSNGLPGPFANLKDLKYGDQFIIHLRGQQYVYEIRNTRLVRPEATAFAFEHLEDHSYLTLITCQSYDPATNSYRLRRVVRAVLVEVK